MKIHFRRLFLTALLCLAPWAAAAESPAMVTDLQGKASTGEGTKRAEVGILASPPAGARLTLADQARLVLVYLKSGQEYELAGPGSYRIGPAAPEPLEGARPAKQRTLAGAYGTARIDTVGKAQAGLVMRSIFIRPIHLTEPSGSLVMAERPTFRWEAVPGATRYRVELDDDAGAVVAEAATDASFFTLPEGIALRDGTVYNWVVETRVGNQKFSSWGQFALLGKSERQRLERLRPGADAPFSERVLFAAELAQMGLKDEARPLWKTLAAERPDDIRLRELAGE